VHESASLRAALHLKSSVGGVSDADFAQPHNLLCCESEIAVRDRSHKEFWCKATPRFTAVSLESHPQAAFRPLRLAREAWRRARRASSRVWMLTFCCCVQAGKIDRRKVELGMRSGPEVEVLSDVDEEYFVVLAKAEALTQGQPVEIADAPK
jgi:hypothetical protein